MKTGIVTADPRKVCWKAYMYHGIIMRCRVSCEPEPVITPPIGPVVVPTTFAYEADCLPESNPDTMERIGYYPGGSRYIQDGKFYKVAAYDYSSDVMEGWGYTGKKTPISDYWNFATFGLGKFPTLPRKYINDAVLDGYIFIPFGTSTYVQFRMIFKPVQGASGWEYVFDYNASYSYIRIIEGGSTYLPLNIVMQVHVHKQATGWAINYNGTVYNDHLNFYPTHHIGGFELRARKWGAGVYIDYHRIWIDVNPS